MKFSKEEARRKVLNCAKQYQQKLLNKKLIIIYRERKGYGTQMLKLMLKFAFDIIGVSSVHLNVFDTNDCAKRCYSNIGFIEESMVENSFTYKEESWGKCHMVITK